MPPQPRRPRTRRVDVPACRDPFINNLLMPLCHAPGEPERFWISTWNSTDGCTGALVDETGALRLYHFREPLRGGFYSAASEEASTLWLWGNLEEVVRLCLDTGRYECFPTGGPNGLVFHGMAYDRPSGKLLATANTYAGAGPTAVCFDTRRCETVRVYEHVALDSYLHGHFANGDGTYTVITEIPGTSLLHWDPQTDEVEVQRLRESVDLHGELHSGSLFRVAQDETGRAYFPHRGWYDPQRRRCVKGGPKPDREMTWFARHGETFVGAAHGDGDTAIGLWERATGKVHEVARCGDGSIHNAAVTASGKLLFVSTYGEFTRRDLATGRLELSRLLPATAVQHTDCLRLIDRDRLLGTPFITQRFWEVNLKTGKGYDCGRAAPGGGEILQTWRMGGRIYMAEYAGGRLVEYDPQVHPHFPENPRVVANPPESNRPIAAADDGRCLYYACSAPYGKLGSTVTRYDTETGESLTVVNPIPDQRVMSLAYDEAALRLLAATHFDADCASCPPTSDKCCIAAFSTEDLSLLAKMEAPPGTGSVAILGATASGRWLCRLSGSFEVGGVAAGDILLEIAADPLEAALLASAWPVPAGWGSVCATGTPGLFLVQVGLRIELWDLARQEPIRVVSRRAAGRRLMVDGDTLFLLGDRDVLVLQDTL